MSKLFLLVSLLSQSAFAATVVKCTGTYEGKKQTVQLKLNESGQIIRWDAKKYVKAEKDSIFFWLTENPEESGIEYHDTFRGKNGYSIVKVGTTADETMLGVNLKVKKGFLAYSDHGSGNGDYKVTLACAPVVR